MFILKIYFVGLLLPFPVGGIKIGSNFSRISKCDNSDVWEFGGRLLLLLLRLLGLGLGRGRCGIAVEIQFGAAVVTVVGTIVVAVVVVVVVVGVGAIVATSFFNNGLHHLSNGGTTWARYIFLNSLATLLK